MLVSGKPSPSLAQPTCFFWPPSWAFIICHVALAIAVYYLKFQIIKLLFTGDFNPISKLFFWQLVGDTLKISSWVFSFVFIAKGFVWLYSISEMLFSFSSFALITFFVPRLGLEGTSVAYAINYFLYFLFILCSLKYKKILWRQKFQL